MGYNVNWCVSLDISYILALSITIQENYHVALSEERNPSDEGRSVMIQVLLSYRERLSLHDGMWISNKNDASMQNYHRSYSSDNDTRGAS